MATRFGGVVKAVLTAVDGMSFLEAKLVQTAALEHEVGMSVPVALMTSFATDAAIREHVVERGLGEPLVFNQFVSLRSTRPASSFAPRTVGRRSTPPVTVTCSRRCGARARSRRCGTAACAS